MADRIGVRAALTALLILLAIAGAQAVGPAVGWDSPSRRVIITVGCALEVALVALLLTLRLRQPDPDPSAARTGAWFFDPAAQLRRILSAVLWTLLVAVPVAVIATGIGHLRIRPAKRPPLPRAGRPTGKARPIVPHAQHSLDLSVLRYILLAVLLAAIIVIAVIISRRLASRPAAPWAPVNSETDTPADLARAVESGQRAIAEIDDARKAIIRCYLAMERSLADAGAERGAAETPDELLARAVTSDLVPPAAAGLLTGLFYEARFSTHPMPGSYRDQAVAALNELAETLRAAAILRAATEQTADPQPHAPMGLAPRDAP